MLCKLLESGVGQGPWAEKANSHPKYTKSSKEISASFRVDGVQTNYLPPSSLRDGTICGSVLISVSVRLNIHW